MFDGQLLPPARCGICGLVSLLAEFVFEVMTNDVQDDGVCGNDAGTAADSNLIMMNDESPQILKFFRC